jgi:hypothetical protein
LIIGSTLLNTHAGNTASQGLAQLNRLPLPLASAL